MAVAAVVSEEMDAAVEMDEAVLGKGLFRGTEEYIRYRWSSTDPATVSKVKMKLAQLKVAVRGKCSCDFQSIELFDDGFAINRKEPAAYHRAYSFFKHSFGAFQVESGNTQQWKVEPVIIAAAVVEGPPSGRWASGVLGHTSQGSETTRISGPFHPHPAFKILRGLPALLGHRAMSNIRLLG